MQIRCAVIAVGELLLSAACATGQVSQFPFRESFDTVALPALPAGWRSTFNRNPETPDFITAAGTARSGSNAVLASNATIGQELYSPLFDLSEWVPDVFEFYTRRSSTFRAHLLVEASTDGGSTYAVIIGDTIRATSSTGYVQTLLHLPHELVGKDSVMLRWRIVPDVTGTTGTFRIDDVALAVIPAHDLAVTGIRIDPPTAIESEPVTAFVTVTNRGGPLEHPVVLRLSRETPGGLLAGKLAETIIDTLAGGDSIVSEISLGPQSPGLGSLMAVVTDTLDQDRSNDTLRTQLRIGYRHGSVVINEFMFAPENPEPEWVEILNRREDALSLYEWALSDAAVGSRHVISTVPVYLSPHGYAVVTRDSLSFREIHPSVRSPLVQVPGFPSLNNEGDAVVIFDLTGRSMDSVAYSPEWGGTGGYSVERIDDEATSSMPSNWGSCRDPFRGTPGDSNSIARKAHDMAIDSLAASPAEGVTGDSIVLTVCVRNVGREVGSVVHVDFYCSSSGDPASNANTLLGTASGPLIVPPLGKVVVSMGSVFRRSGNYRLLARLPTDEDTLNNSRSVALYVSHRPGAIRINEIMFDPSGGFPEWVELVNLSNDTVDLTDWKVGNRNTASRYRIPWHAGGIPPGGFSVVTRDTASLVNQFGALPVVQAPSLPMSLWNNSADAAVVIDPKLGVADSAVYRDSWRGSLGGSLERVDPPGMSLDSLNWGGSIDPSGATPGRINSIALLSHDLRAGRLWAIADSGTRSVELHLRVQNAGKSSVTGYGVKFSATSVGETSAQQESVVGRIVEPGILVPVDSSEAVVVWRDAPSGLWKLMALIDTTGDERPSNNGTSICIAVPFAAGTLVINEIMYDPLAGGSEYVEVLNRSKSRVDVQAWVLSRWSESGTGGKITLSSRPCVLPSGGYLLMASDSDIIAEFPSVKSRDPSLIRIGSWGSFALANAGEKILLSDGAGMVIDSVVYSPQWHRAGIGDVSGHALERICPTLGSNDPRNWSTSVDGRGGTPAEKNSIVVEGETAARGLTFSPNPFSPDGDGYEDFTMIHYNIPTAVAVANIKIFDVRGRLVRWLANNEATGMQGDVVWDGRNDARGAVRVGVYIVLLEASDDKGNLRWSARGAIVVARKL